MKGTRYEMHINVLIHVYSLNSLKHLKQMRGEEQKNMYDTRHRSAQENPRHKTRKVQEYVRHVRHKSTYGTKRIRHDST